MPQGNELLHLKGVVPKGLRKHKLWPRQDLMALPLTPRSKFFVMQVGLRKKSSEREGQLWAILTYRSKCSVFVLSVEQYGWWSASFCQRGCLLQSLQGFCSREARLGKLLCTLQASFPILHPGPSEPSYTSPAICSCARPCFVLASFFEVKSALAI